MGLISLFNDKPSTTGAVTMETLEESEDIWRHTPFSSYVAGEDLHSVYVRGRTPVLVPSYVVDFVSRCTQFRPLAEHIAKHAESHAWGSLEIDALRSWMRKVKEAGMFISRGELHARAVAIHDPQASPAKITAIGFPTAGDHVELVTRALTSFVENVRAHGRTADFIIADSSPHPAQRGRLRAQTGELSRDLDLPVRYLGEPEKRRMAAELVRRSGCRPEAVEFGLFDPHGAGFACGGNRNALLLHEAGGVLSTVDDDAICELGSGPATESRLALFSNGDPYERCVFDDREGAIEAVTFKARDYLAEHEKLLGRDLGDLMQQTRVEEVDVARAGLGLLRLVEFGAARVRTTFTGYAGDPDSPASSSYFFHKGLHRERPARQKEGYRAGLAERSVSARVPVPSLGDDSVSSGLAVGLDHRELLPPFFPVLRAEDIVFNAAAWKCCVGFVSGHLPFSVRRDSSADPTTLLPGELNRERRTATFEFAQIVRAVMAGYQPAPHFDTVTRMRKLGRYFSEFAARPAADFREALQQVVLGHESRKIIALEESLRTETDAPDFWRRDIQDFVDYSREALEHEDFDIPYELKARRTIEENRELMQKLIRGYGLLLEDWPAIVSAARDLRREGVTFSSTAVGE